LAACTKVFPVLTSTQVLVSSSQQILRVWQLARATILCVKAAGINMATSVSTCQTHKPSTATLVINAAKNQLNWRASVTRLSGISSKASRENFRCRIIHNLDYKLETSIWTECIICQSSTLPIYLLIYYTHCTHSVKIKTNIE